MSKNLKRRLSFEKSDIKKGGSFGSPMMKIMWMIQHFFYLITDSKIYQIYFKRQVLSIFEVFNCEWNFTSYVNHINTFISDSGVVHITNRPGTSSTDNHLNKFKF